MWLSYRRIVYCLGGEVRRGHHRCWMSVLRGIILVKLWSGTAAISGRCNRLGCVAEAGAHEGMTDCRAVILASIRALLPLETASTFAYLIGVTC